MQFIDLATQQNRIKDKLNANIQKVLSHGQYIMGPEVKELETKLASYVGTKHAVSCASGTDALLMALMAYHVGPGDAIFTTPFTFIATAEVISLLGATPVFVDIDPKTFNIDPEKLERAIQAIKSKDSSIYPLPSVPLSHASGAGFLTSDFRPLISGPLASDFRPLTSGPPSSGLRARSVIPVDLFGLPADYNRIVSIAEKHDLFVIEDAAQSFGAEYDGKKACAFGNIACTSFFPAKPLGCYGDGGMCFTDDDNLAGIMRSIRVHGKGNDKYDNIRIGINGRLDTLQAAILAAKFDIFPEEIELRQQAAQLYTEKLRPLSSVVCPLIPGGCKSVWAQYSVLAENDANRSALQDKLKKNGVPTAVYYPKPLHLQTAYAYLGYKAGDFPVSESISERIFSLPMHPYLEADEQDKVANALSVIR